MADIKKDFSKVIGAIRNESGARFPKAMMTSQQIVKRTATVNCGGEWGTLEGTARIAEKVLNDERFIEFLEKHSATASIELNQFGTQQIRISY